jgi:predicted GIY-YIG superfamily endonuclease
MRAPCRVCRREVALTRRGRVWLHRARPLVCPCPGSRRAPWSHAEPLPEPSPLPGQILEPDPTVREHNAGTVYLLHLDRPFGHARHYTGWAAAGNLAARLAHHQAGSGANLLRHVAKAGISWSLARTWPGDRHRERQLKARGASRRCPVCHPELADWLQRRHAATHPPVGDAPGRPPRYVCV